MVDLIPLSDEEPLNPGMAPIWNPKACADWSVLFSPIFGSYLQMLNWRALGEPQKESSAKGWLYVSLAFYTLLPGYLSVPKYSHYTSPWAGLAVFYLVIWYLAAGRAQCKYVDKKFGADYSRKPWSKVLLIAIGGVLTLLVVQAVVGALFSMFLTVAK